MIEFFIEKLILEVPYKRENIKRIFQEGQKHNFKYFHRSFPKEELSIDKVTDLAQEGSYQYSLKSWWPKHICVSLPELHFNIWFKDKDGLLSVSIDTDYPDKQFEDEWAIYPDSHYYLRAALKLCAPFCIKSIETNTMD